MNIEDFKSFLVDVLNNPEKMGNMDEVLAKSLNMYKELVEPNDASHWISCQAIIHMYELENFC